MSSSGKKIADEGDEVEVLLRAAQDELLLNMNLNSHMARASVSTAIDPDLDRRFQALKKPTKVFDPPKNGRSKAGASSGSPSGGTAADDDLLARFAALKSSLPSRSMSDSSNFHGGVLVNQEAGEDGESEDEVEKVIKWAIDAARLDPSPPSDDDDDDDDDDDGASKGRKGKRK